MTLRHQGGGSPGKSKLRHYRISGGVLIWICLLVAGITVGASAQLTIGVHQAEAYEVPPLVIRHNLVSVVSPSVKMAATSMHIIREASGGDHFAQVIDMHDLWNMPTDHPEVINRAVAQVFGRQFDGNGWLLRQNLGTAPSPDVEGWRRPGVREADNRTHPINIGCIFKIAEFCFPYHDPRARAGGCRGGKFMCVGTSLVNLPEGQKVENSHQDGNASYPHGSIGSKPSRPVLGGLFFLLGFALLKFAFYVADEPLPPISTRVLYWTVGLFSAACIFQGVRLIFGLV